MGATRSRDGRRPDRRARHAHGSSRRAAHARMCGCSSRSGPRSLYGRPGCRRHFGSAGAAPSHETIDPSCVAASATAAVEGPGRDRRRRVAPTETDAAVRTLLQAADLDVCCSAAPASAVPSSPRSRARLRSRTARRRSGHPWRQTERTASPSGTPASRTRATSGTPLRRAASVRPRGASGRWSPRRAAPEHVLATREGDADGPAAVLQTKRGAARGRSRTSRAGALVLNDPRECPLSRMRGEDDVWDGCRRERDPCRSRHASRPSSSRAHRFVWSTAAGPVRIALARGKDVSGRSPAAATTSLKVPEDGPKLRAGEAYRWWARVRRCRCPLGEAVPFRLAAKDVQTDAARFESEVGATGARRRRNGTRPVCCAAATTSRSAPGAGSSPRRPVSVGATRRLRSRPGPSTAAVGRCGSRRRGSIVSWRSAPRRPIQNDRLHRPATRPLRPAPAAAAATSAA